MRASELLTSLLLSIVLVTAASNPTRADEPINPSAVLTPDTASAPAKVSEPSSSDPPGYRIAVEQALAELSRGHFSEARAMFMRAHELSPSARTLRGLALAEFEQRSYLESIQHFEQALAHPVRPLDERLRAQAEELMTRARTFITRLELSVKPANAIAKLDGQVVDPGKGPLLLNEGEHSVEAEAEGYRAEQRKFRALGGDTQRLTLSLASIPTARAQTPEPEARPLRKNPWLWAGVGVLVVGAAVTAGVLSAGGKSHEAPPYGGTSNVVIPGL